MARYLSLMTFLVCCISLRVFSDESASTPPSPPSVQQTVDRAIGYLQTETVAWASTRKCAACHHAAMGLWALGEADRRGYAVDKTYVADMVEAALGSRDKMMAASLVPNPALPPDTRPLAGGLNMGQVFMAVAAQSLSSLGDGQKESIRWIADEAVKKQREDGSWEFFLRQPPVTESQASNAVWITMALQGVAGEPVPESRQVAIQKGSAWLAGAAKENFQDVVLDVVLASRAGKSREEMQGLIDKVLAQQRPDGGWAQLAEMPSDAFATGQSLYALSLVGYRAEQPEIARAIDFLVSTQAADGSWPMTSRSTPDGSPGSAKLLTPITCAAAAWGTLGLVGVAPKI